MPIKTHLVEHASMPPCGLSARTHALASALASDETFDSHQTFVDALDRVQLCIQGAPGDTHLVVICTHGLEDTGTWLLMDDSQQDQRPESLPHDLAPKARGSVVIYMAVCWGGYPGVLRRFQHGDHPWPTVVGALAPLTALEGNELQDELFEVLTRHGLDEARLRSTVESFNSKYGGEYGHPAARIALSDATAVPKQGTAGIAWSLLRDEDDAPMDGPFEVATVDSGRVTVTFDAVTAAMPVGRLQLAKRGAVLVGDRFRFKAKRSPCGRYLQAVGDVTRA